MVTSTVQNMMQWPPMKQLAGNTHHYILIQYNVMKPALSLYILYGLSTQCLSSSCANKYIIMVCLNILEHDEHVLHHLKLVTTENSIGSYQWTKWKSIFAPYSIKEWLNVYVKCFYMAEEIFMYLFMLQQMWQSIFPFSGYTMVLSQGRLSETPLAMWFLWWWSIQGPVSRCFLYPSYDT